VPKTVEAALVQLFIEAKRHQPSILYIPALVAWSNTLSDSAKATFKSLLDGIQPSEPILLLGLAESADLGTDVRGWFGWNEEATVDLDLTNTVSWSCAVYLRPTSSEMNACLIEERGSQLINRRKNAKNTLHHSFCTYRPLPTCGLTLCPGAREFWRRCNWPRRYHPAPPLRWNWPKSESEM
jgi:hypothetical protein